MNIPKSVSYSRLGVYDECSQLYRLAYVDKSIERSSDTVATRIGSFCHLSLENQLNDETGTVVSPYDELVKADGIWDQELAKYNLTELKGRLQAYAHHTTALFERASARYKGSDAIRKADGSLSVAPWLTKPWTEYIKAHGLEGMQMSIDALAAKAAPKRWKDVSLAQTYAESLGIMYTYRHHAHIDRVVAVELPISEFFFQGADEFGNALFDEAGEPVPTTRQRGPHPIYEDPKTGKTVFLRVDNPYYLPKLDAFGKLIKDADGNYERRDDIVLTAYLDLVSRCPQGELDVIDHKTSGGEVPEPSKIARHEQLLSYGFILATAAGQVPARIGVNHLRSGKLIMAPFDMAQAELAMERLLSVVEAAVDKQVYLKQHPDGFHSKCIRKAGDPRKPLMICAGLAVCHPEVARSLGIEVPSKKAS